MIATLSMFSACDNSNENAPLVDETLNAEIITSFSNNIATAKYDELQSKTSLLNDQVLALEASSSESNLNACRQTWRDARKVWEQSESILFGPVSTENIDPRIDTWPVNFTDLDAQLASEHEFSETYIDNLEDALKGFHPVEYLLFGENGEKKFSDFTPRQFEYLKGLTSNIKKLTTELDKFWDTKDSDSYYHEFITAGKGSTVYKTQRAAFEEMVNAMIGICDEVANGKIAEPFLQQDPSLEESPFAQSSITDFTNNVKGVQNVYLGNYGVDGKGLEDLVRQYNLQLDGQIKLKLSNAITALNNVTDPFGEAITSQPIQVQNAIDAINDLKTILEDDLLVFVQQHSN